VVTVILVHGRSQQGQDPLSLEREWERTLLSGLAAGGISPLPALEQILFPYYGDLYDDYSLAARQPSSVAEKRKRLEFERAIATEIQARLTARKKRLPPGPKKGAAGLLDPLLELLDRIPGFGRGFVRLVFRDVYDYLHDVSGLRRRTMERVSTPIRSSQGETVAIIAHSLGSIIAYDILNTHPELAVDLFITTGSPLAIDKGVRSQLLPDAGGELGAPAGVRAWVNFADPDDIVALGGTLRDAFPRNGKPFVTDVAVRNPKSSPHDSLSYLRQPRLAAAVGTVL
jgi:hypothetical protein